MTLWAIVPVKPLRLGKSRLANVLTQDERAGLNRLMLTHTLKTLAEVPEIEQILVTSRDPAALALAREHGARTVLENGSPKLNLALTRAAIIARSFMTRGVLIVHADLPMMAPEDISAVIARAHEPPVVAIVPDRHRQGTNLLLVNPVGLIEFGFGPNSFQRHCDRAVKAGARLEIIDRPSLALDVDLPEDLELVGRELHMEDFAEPLQILSERTLRAKDLP